MHIIHELDRLKWADFVYNHPQGNIFQSPEMYDVYEKTTGYEPIFLAVADSNHKMLALLLAVIQRDKSGPIGALTTRAIVYGGPLVMSNDLKALDILLSQYDDIITKRAIFTQTRNLWDFSDFADVFAGHGYQYSEHLNYFIKLTKGQEKLFSNLSASKRRQIRKALGTDDLQVTDVQDDRDIIAFYAMLHNHYSKTVRKPLPPIDFFFAIRDILVSRNLAKIFVVKYKDEIIGGMVSPISHNYCKRTVYEFYVCGSRKHNRLYPSVLTTWAPIRWGADNGVDFFDFMGAGKPTADYGVRDFKAKFGGELVNYGRFEKIHQPFGYTSAKIGFKLWRWHKKLQR